MNAALVLSLIGIPWAVSLLLLFSPKVLGKALVIGAAAVLSGISLAIFISGETVVSFSVPTVFNHVMMGLDVLMLLYFAGVAWKYRSWLVGLMTGLQLGILGVLFQTLSETAIEHGHQFSVDRLSMFMYLLINIVSGLICVYAVKYIDEEHCSEQRKRNFLATLLWFVGVMNFIVSVDNMEWFFLLFETTTLASFWLIRFRGDEVSNRNALRALWMNQIGGVAILVALIVVVRTPAYATLQFSSLVAKGSSVGFMLPFALISIAALIKGAQMPFSSWLLGAMVAPTPVSALLHSSTMVKLAPFIILRLSPAMKGSYVSTTIMLLSAFVFVVASLGALAKDNFKLILAHSTIALLSLMIMLAAIGTEVAVMACLILVLFHGVSKCLLFLEAGVLEHVFHIKHTTQIQKLGEIGPRTAFMIAFGFMSLMLPPFGVFIAKWIGIELFASSLPGQSIVSLLMLLSLVVGGAVLSVVYFKVVGSALMRSGVQDRPKGEQLAAAYYWVPGILATFLFAGMVAFIPLVSFLFAPVAIALLPNLANVSIDAGMLVLGATRISLYPIIAALLMFPAVFVAARFIKFKGVDRVGEYTCGEKIELDFSAYYFSFDKLQPYFVATGIAFFISIVLTGRIPL